MFRNEVNEDIKKLYNEVLYKDLEPVELGSKLLEIANSGTSITIDYRGVLDVVFLRENLKTNKAVRKLTGIITGLTILNLIFVVISTYYIVLS